MPAININGNIIDPAKPQPGQLPPDASKTKFIILQCSHRPSVEEYSTVKKLGVQILNVVAESSSHTSYLCRYDKDDLKVLEKLNFVQHALVYIPEFVTETSLKKSISSSSKPISEVAVTIRLHDTTKETGKDLLKQIEKFGKCEPIDANEIQLRAKVNPSSLPEIAKLDLVKTIERTNTVELRTAIAHDVLRAGQYRPAVIEQGLKGKGEVIAVADAGLDLGDTQNIHPAFRVGGVPNGKSRVRSISNHKPKAISNDKSELQDDHGHGTHVAACAVGFMKEKLEKEDEDYAVDRINAPASEAELIFQVVTPGSAMPDLMTMFHDAITEDASIHSNSWGHKSFVDEQLPYTTSESELIDSAMSIYRQLLIVWAAGNDGHKFSNHDIGGGEKHIGNSFMRQIGGEAAAKNAITVGATINRRRIPNTTPGNSPCVDGDAEQRSKTERHVTEVWLGSSKGPTRELRLKPDVVAPGVGILSARSRGMSKTMQQHVDDPEEALDKIYRDQGPVPSKSFCFMSGSSQAAPLVASCAAVLRQSLILKRKSKCKPGQAIVEPSGALIKALLVNGATDLAGTTLKVPALNGKKFPDVLMPAAPNTAQGFGEVNLERSLKCVQPEVEGGGDAVDYGYMEQAGAQTVEILVPAGKNNIRITMAYNDKPGKVIQDKLDLTLACQAIGSQNFGAPIRPDPIVHLPWQRDPTKATLPGSDVGLQETDQGFTFAHNNVQRIRCSVIGMSKVKLTVTATEITPPDGISLGHACCWLFD